MLRSTRRLNSVSHGRTESQVLQPSHSSDGADHATPLPARLTALQTLPERPLRSIVSREEPAENNDGIAVMTAGRLEVIIGPMFSGKTSELLRKVEMEESAGNRVLAVKSTVDTRYAVTTDNRSYIVSHCGIKKECIAVSKLSSVEKLFADQYRNAQVIAIDEAQFFTDLLKFCQKAADQDCKIIYAAGLDGDFRRKPFRLAEKKASAMMHIIPMADTVTKHRARCHYCGQPAPFTFRTIQDDSEVLVGGGEMYVPVCRAHYLSKWEETHSSESETSPSKQQQQL